MSVAFGSENAGLSALKVSLSAVIIAVFVAVTVVFDRRSMTPFAPDAEVAMSWPFRVTIP